MQCTHVSSKLSQDQAGAALKESTCTLVVECHQEASTAAGKLLCCGSSLHFSQALLWPAAAPQHLSVDLPHAEVRRDLALGCCTGVSALLLSHQATDVTILRSSSPAWDMRLAMTSCTGSTDF